MTRITCTNEECSKYGKKVSKRDKYCQSCGKRVMPKVSKRDKYCQSCGKRVMPKKTVKHLEPGFFSSTIASIIISFPAIALLIVTFSGIYIADYHYAFVEHKLVLERLPGDWQNVLNTIQNAGSSFEQYAVVKLGLNNSLTPLTPAQMHAIITEVNSDIQESLKNEMLQYVANHPEYYAVTKETEENHLASVDVISQ